MRQALVLAAGKSTRLGDFASGLPKPLLEVEGQSLLARNLRWLASFGVRDVWINLYHEAERIVEHVGDGSAWGVRVQYSHEPQLLGTAGAFKNLAGAWDGSTVVVYGDNLLSFNLLAMASAHEQSRAMATVALFDFERGVHSGIAGGRVRLDADGRVTAFVEGDSDSPYVNAGVYILETAVLECIPPDCFQDFGRDVFPRMLSDGRLLRGHFIDGWCLGLDTPETVARALALIDAGKVILP